MLVFGFDTSAPLGPGYVAELLQGLFIYCSLELFQLS
jgi:hypothetical protein